MDTLRWLGIAVAAAVLLCPLLATGVPSHHAGDSFSAHHPGHEEPMIADAAGLHAVDQDCCHHDGAGVPASKTFAAPGLAVLTGAISGPATPQSPTPSAAPAASAARIVTPLRC